MKDETRAAIRVFYFVDRRSVGEIAATIGLHPMAVRAALVLAGGDRGGPTTPASGSAALRGIAPVRATARGPMPDGSLVRRVTARSR